MTAILNLVLVLLLLCASLAAGRRHYVEPCPDDCTCQPFQPERSSQSLNDLYRMSRFQRIIFGHRGFSFRPLSSKDGREMTCLGLINMPSTIPSDIKKLSLFGDSVEDSYQGDDPRDDGNSYNEKTSRYSKKPFEQLTTLSRNSFFVSPELKQLAIEGNRIKILHPREFDMLKSLKKLSLRNNRIQMLPVRALKGLKSLEFLDLSENHIEEIQKTIFNDVQKVKQLKLSKNRIYYLEEKVFKNLNTLEILDLSNNALNDLPSDIFESLVNLKELYLDGNTIKFVGWNWFRSLTNLEKLSLKGNGIQYIPPASIETLQSLRVLSLSDNSIRHISNATFTTTHSKLETLDLSNNSISMIEPDTIDPLKSLVRLLLRHNRIKSIEGMFQMNFSTVNVLDLAHNRIEVLRNKDIRNLNRLNNLDMSYNNLKTIRTRTFTGFIDLRILKLDHNDIRDIETEAFSVALVNNMSKMTWIYLQYNRITTLAKRALYGLPYLKFLNLCHNRITSIDNMAFEWLASLNSLMINNNKLSQLESGTFQKLNSLVHLNMAANKIREVPFNTFLGLESVEEINLDSNFIKTLATDIFLDTPRLRRVSMKKNRIRNLNMETFESMTSLRYLSLDKNKISEVKMPKMFQENLKYLSLTDNNLKTLDKSIIKMMRAYGYMHLRGNPWSCDCRLAWVPTQGNRVRIANDQDLTCKGPTALAGSLILSLRPSQMKCLKSDQYESSTLKMSARQRGGLTCALDSAAIADASRRSMRWKKKVVFPMHASVMDSSQNPTCNGVLIDKDWVMTLASCWLNNSMALDWTSKAISVRFGEYRPGRSTDFSRRVKSVFYHPSMDDENKFNIALVKLQPSSITTQDNYPCVLTTGQVSEIQRYRMKGVFSSRLRNTGSTSSKRVKLRMALLKPTYCRKADYICGKSKIFKSASKYSTLGSPLYVEMGHHGFALAGIHTEFIDANQGGFVPSGKYASWMADIIRRH